jgi:Arc/MetJ-type ribon-helix-helix transcriptional regulator
VGLRRGGVEDAFGKSIGRGIPKLKGLAFRENIYILQYMKALLVELDDEMAAKLERVAPGRARQRSEFIRNAIRRALWDIEEQATAEAYQRQPDSSEDAYLNPVVWEPPPRPRRTRKRQ